MLKQIYLYTFFTLCLLLFSCNKEKQDESGVIFTFDDQFISEWYSAKDLFNAYNIKATFFINRPQSLTAEKVLMLKQLREDGHEIACHGMNHVNLNDFLFTNTVKDYIDQEIIPAIEKMKELELDVKSFAYPFGVNDQNTDEELLKYFKVLRKATYNIENVTLDKIDRTFTKIGTSRVIDAMGIDNQYCISIENLEKGMIRASSRNEVLVLHAHRIVENDSGYSISREYLEKAFILSQKYFLKSITISELVP